MSDSGRSMRKRTIVGVAALVACCVFILTRAIGRGESAAAADAAVDATPSRDVAPTNAAGADDRSRPAAPAAAAIARARIFGRVVDETGDPVALAYVRVGPGFERLAADASGETKREAATGSDGRFDLGGFVVDASRSETRLIVESRGFATADVAAEPSVETIVVLKRVGPRTIELRFTSSAPTPPVARVVVAPDGRLVSPGRATESFHAAAIVDMKAVLSGAFCDVVDVAVWVDGFVTAPFFAIRTDGSTPERPVVIDVPLSKGGVVTGEIEPTGEGDLPIPLEVAVWPYEGPHHDRTFAPRLRRSFDKVGPYAAPRILDELRARFCVAERAPDAANDRRPFRIEGLVPGSYLIAVLEADGYALLTEPESFSIVGEETVGPIVLKVRRGRRVTVRMTLGGLSIPMIGTLRGPEGRFNGVPHGAACRFETAPKGRYVMRPGFNVVDCFGPRYPKTNWIGPVYSRLWTLAGIEGAVEVGGADVDIDYKLDDAIARLGVWLDGGGREVVAKEAARLDAARDRTEVRIDDPAPEARVVEALLTYRRLMFAGSAAHAGDPPPGFVDAVLAVDPVRFVLSMTVVE